MFDSHAHLNDEQFADDRDAAIQRAWDAGLEGIINVGSDLDSSRQAVALAHNYEGLYAVVGVHPHDASTGSDEVLAGIARAAADPKAVAIGEIGLDYYYDYSPREKQQEVFIAQLRLARDLGLPAVIHSRDAARDTMDIIRKYAEIPCILHCYSGSLEMAREYLAWGHYISFAGPITFKNAVKTTKVAAGLPLERLLVETDCPYLAPVPRRGRRNEPAYVVYVAEKLAELQGCSVEDVARVTAENTRSFFGLKS